MGLINKTFKRNKNRYLIEVTRSKDREKIPGERARVWYYQYDRVEAMYDAYWAFIFSNATRVRIRKAYCRSHDILFEINSIKEWEDYWIRLYGENARYFVMADRH